MKEMFLNVIIFIGKRRAIVKLMNPSKRRMWDMHGNSPLLAIDRLVSMNLRKEN